MSRRHKGGRLGEILDRLGRKSDETSFIVEWLTKKGIKVWSVNEGEQRFESHTDRLTNYIHFWQADGESQKNINPNKNRYGANGYGM